MKTGIAMLLALTVAGVFLGIGLGKWLVNQESRDPGLAEPIAMVIGAMAGGLGGLGAGLGIAYALGRRQGR